MTPLIVGAGEMAEAYVLALRALGVEPAVVGRSRERAEALAAQLGVEVRWGGLEAVDAVPGTAIVAVDPQELAAVTSALLARGCRAVLVEKPGARVRGDLEKLRGARVAIGLNRRFYPSVDAARRLIDEDGGPLSASFDFTEIPERVLAEERRREVLERWGLVNSLHVIDLFQHLAGLPAEWRGERAGGLQWHPAGARFAGSGCTARGALFGYLATWDGAGRWSVEVTTHARKLVLRPLEELRVQAAGSFALEPVGLEAEPAGLKPGLLGQVRAFLAWAEGGERDPRLCDLDEFLAVFALTEAIFGYGSPERP